MKKDISKFIKLKDLVSLSFRRKHIIVLEPEENEPKDVSRNIIYDKAEWKIPDKIVALVDELSGNTQLSNEEKILIIYEELCKVYVYDDNIISYIQKVDDDTYSLPDWYGRDVGQEWEKNREQHNRRVCYEVSRYLAKALKELFKNQKDFYVTILWDKALTHYFVGLTCNEYSITLDLDDFNNIKDLTRLKTGLTAEGIIIFEDKENKFKRAIDQFNQDRTKNAITKIESEVDNNNDVGEDTSLVSEAQKLEIPIESDEIAFLRNVIEILREKYKLDSQGLYEYIKEIVDIKLGPKSRKKVWKEIKGKDNEETRYIRCLVLDIEGEKYIIDVDSMTLRRFDEDELKRVDREFFPYKELLGEEIINYRTLREDRYNGR